jgi:hypothetical protein
VEEKKQKQERSVAAIWGCILPDKRMLVRSFRTSGKDFTLGMINKLCLITRTQPRRGSKSRAARYKLDASWTPSKQNYCTLKQLVIYRTSYFLYTLLNIFITAIVLSMIPYPFFFWTVFLLVFCSFLLYLFLLHTIFLSHEVIHNTVHSSFNFQFIYMTYVITRSFMICTLRQV